MQSPVPALAHSLRALDRILQKAEAYCEARRIDPAVLVNDRLAPDMLPLRRQVGMACDHAKFVAARLSGQEAPRFEDTEQTFAELRERIARTLAFVEAVPEAAFEGAEARTITVKAGPRELTFPAPVYLGSFALPNFYFHMTTAYNILRHDGVELGKLDFLGG
ncbi:DUF1993 domain-containing protein [Rubellimicrobium roseum]|uniref:DUF1993 domain-containing protein n=1 Tax=Rubellimicrobium roseum TaxID=687525 RepID=A0A5C4NQG4_9RHOB|nr:DUF1993 domain-containing protein [Rubellimicrobium roseum]TNC74629.1 DUF1993 domain-containing protein [Rubellimicrobium roseum]